MKPFIPRENTKYIGKYRPKIEGREKASGITEYLDDIAMKNRFPQMLYAKVLRSPYPHARIKKIDKSEAEKLNGVRAILTYDDPEVAALKPTTAAWCSPSSLSYDRMWWPNYKDRRVLSDHVCWVGDEAGVVVAAETEEIAEEALKLLKIEWEVLPFVLDIQEAMKEEAPVIHPEINPDGNVIPPEDLCGPDVFLDKGDVEQGFENADAVIEVESEYQNNDQGCLDTRGCLMYWKDDRLTCWTNYYQSDQTRMHIANMLDLPLNKVRVINPYIGGSFGRGNTGDQPFFIFTAILSQRTGRPVRYKLSRREDFHDTSNRINWTCKMGATKDGKIVSAYFKGFCNAGAYCDHSVAAIKFIPGVEISECMLAHIPNLKMEAYAVYTNIIPASCMRGIGNNEFNLCLGLAVDTLAKKMEMDPVELAIKNFGHEWGRTPDKSLEAVLREGAKRIGWEKRHKTNEGPTFEGTKKRGIGFSFHMGWHTLWQEKPRGHIQAGIRLNPDMTVILEAPMVETGVGSNTCAVLACAENLSFLGIKPEGIHWISTVDTDTGYKDQVQTDSAVAYLHAEVMPKIAQELKDKILVMAAAKMETIPEKLDIEEGRIIFKESPEKGLAVRDLLWQGDMVPVLVTVNEMLPYDEVEVGIPFAATFAEVEVDTETGQVEVLKLVVLDDLGTVMLASGAEGQQTGGQAMALGATFMEEIVYDKATGIPLNFNWVDYRIPTMADIPEIDPVLMEVWKGNGEYGACGMGECVITRTARAVSNAIYNAAGIRVDDLPIKPWKVLKALGRANENGGKNLKENAN